MIHNTFLVQGQKVLASSRYWPITVTQEELDEFIKTRNELRSEQGSVAEIALIVGNRKFLARPCGSQRLLIFVTDKGEDEHLIGERLEKASADLEKKIVELGIRKAVSQYTTLIEQAVTTRLKIALVGEGGVGKTTTLNLLLGNTPPLSYVPTIALNLETVENIRFGNYSLVIWDFAGQERFRTLWRFYFHGADVIFLVCDSTLRNVIISKDILKLIKRDAPKVPVFALANKQDKPNAMKPEVVQKILGIPTYPMVAIDKERRDEMLRILISAAAQYVGVALPDLPPSELIRFADQAVREAEQPAKAVPPHEEAEEAEEEMEVVEEVFVDEEGHIIEGSDEYEVVEEVVEVMDEETEPTISDQGVSAEETEEFEVQTAGAQSTSEESGPALTVDPDAQAGLQIAKDLLSGVLDADEMVAAEIDRVPHEEIGEALDALRSEETVTAGREETTHEVADEARKDLERILGPTEAKEPSQPSTIPAESPKSVSPEELRELEKIIGLAPPDEKPSETKPSRQKEQDDEESYGEDLYSE